MYVQRGDFRATGDILHVADDRMTEVVAEIALADLSWTVDTGTYSATIAADTAAAVDLSYLLRFSLDGVEWVDTGDTDITVTPDGASGFDVGVDGTPVDVLEWQAPPVGANIVLSAADEPTAGVLRVVSRGIVIG